VIEEPPRREVQGTDPRSHHVVVVSAKTAYSFRQNQKRLHDFLLAHPETPIEDVAYTTTARKLHHPIRSTYVATSITELIQCLSKDLSSNGKIQSAPDKRPIVFSFAGQGSQYIGMGKQLFETSSSFRKTILEHEVLCTGLGLPSFLHVITETTGDIATVSPAQVHCAIVSLGVALASLWMSWGVQPSLVIGHSIGEYCALTIAGVLSLADAFYLVAKRGELIEERCDKNSRIMVVMNASKERLDHLLDSVLPNGSYQVSCMNAPGSTVVSVSVDVLALLETTASKASIKTTRLSMPYAFHSSQMDTLLEDFGDLAKGVQFHTPQIPVASTLLGKLVDSSGTFSASYLMRQTREPVIFQDAVEIASATQPNAVWIEHGPNATCAPSIRATLNDVEAIVASSLRGSKENCWKTISKTLAQIYAGGVPINWQAYHREYAQALRLVELPTYAFDLKNYWLQYEGNWALEKNHHQCPSTAEVVSSLPVPPVSPAFSTTCLHRIESERFKDGDSSVSFISSLNEPALHELISGHFVNGIGLCPTSVYAEMALTAAKYVFSKLNPTKQIPTMDIRNFEIFRPLVLRNGEQGHTVRLLATKSANSESVQIVINSQTRSASQDHARCVVKFGDGALWAKSWRRNSFLISDRIKYLQHNSAGEAIDTLRGGMVYKIFSEIVDYPESYRGIKKVTMNSALNETTAKVKFRKTPSDATFTCDPCWIDCIAQVPGFLLNGSATKPPNLVFLSTGWESLRVAIDLSCEVEYTCYVRMQKSDSPGVLIGDVSLFEGDEIVAVGAGLRFHEVKKDALHRILPGSRNHSRPPPAMEMQSNRSHETAQKTNSRATARDHVKAKNELSDTWNKKPVFEATSLFPLVLQLIAKEVGVDLEELSNDANFEDLGIDSLLTISIGTKLREELQLDLPMALFSQCETVAQLRDYFRKAYPDITAGPGYSSDDSPSDDNGEDTGVSSATPVSEESIEHTSKSNIVDVIVAVIANETGIAEEDIDPDTDLADLGVDSLMTIAILGVVNAQTDQQLPASVFSDYPTISALRKGLGKPNAPKEQSKPLAKYASSSAQQLRNESKFDTEKYKSNVVLLQGDPKSAHPPLFLIADGAGSAASYLKFPHFPSNLPVYALESPFLHCPFEFTCTIEQICEIFVAAILAKRPYGPYFMGGWSVGGTFAYEAARQLIVLGQRVDGVVLIDSPCPRKMDGVISLSLELLDELGLFVGIPTRGGEPDTPMPREQKQHIMGCVQAVIAYEPKPLTPAQRPLCTYIIWSERGMFEQLNDKVREISDQIVRPGEEKVGINPDWLTGVRTSFGPKGWDRLLGDCDCHKTDGDHFSCMNMPRVSRLPNLCSVVA
jgi:iterative type I PKS product template protein